MNILIVEDTKYRVDWFEEKFKDHTVWFADNAKLAKSFLSNHKFDLVFLDHDLSGRVFVDPTDSDSGSEVVRYICTIGANIDLIVVHSHNEPNSMRMCATLMEAGYAVCRTPFKTLANKAMKARLMKEN